MLISHYISMVYVRLFDGVIKVAVDADDEVENVEEVDNVTL